MSGAGLPPDPEPDPAPSEDASDAPTPSFALLIERLTGRTPMELRYAYVDPIARGGMGEVLKVWDDDLRRHLAMKVILGKPDPEDPTRSLTPDRSLGRFLEEAQITGQLDHPGIVPVHELGLDSSGRVFFTMRLVRGRDLREVIESVHEEREGWNPTRALNVLLRVCEAMAYAHSKGVVHRDLKPANIMVGRFGEVYVMDWGLAKVIGRADARDLRLKVAQDLSSLWTLRDDDSREADEPLITMDGAVVGTPAYMPPEQARGEVENVDRRSDVYSVGAILYHLLSGHMPYCPANARPSARAVWSRVLEGPPNPIHEADGKVPPELQAICEKAMAREQDDRYADMGELASDLRAYLEHRVVGAYESGAWAEFKKLVRRNRVTAASVGLAFLVVLVGSISANVFVSAKNSDLRIARDDAQRRTEEVLSLSAMQDLEDLRRRAELLWPATPDRITQYVDWLDLANDLLADLAKHERDLAALRGRALITDAATRDLDRREHPRAEGLENERVVLSLLRADLDQARGAGAETDTLEERIEASSKKVADLEEHVTQQWRWRFEDRDDRWWHDRLQLLVQGLVNLRDPETGLLSGLSPEYGMGIARRLELARGVEESSIGGVDVARDWEEAVRSIADPSACPAYAGLRITPQLGLVPIGRDPGSGLWEFAHVQTGETPQRDASGALRILPESAVVLVLLPGGEFDMGGQRSDADAPGYDVQARRDEAPVRRMRVSPFFLSKYELTQAQWARFSGTNPSHYAAGANPFGQEVLPTNPVESVDWEDCRRTVAWMGMELPTEAQWEYATRGGTGTSWLTGDGRDSLRGFVNIADQTGQAAGTTWLEQIRWPELEDGYAVHSPVGSFLPNAFGLHDLHGNLWEWCRDAKASYRPYLTDGDVAAQGAGYRAIRGGAFYFPAEYARSARRYGNLPLFKLAFLGVRPMRRLER